MSVVFQLQVLSACVGLAWLFCLPAISLTTFELKPRSLYFDDTSMAPLAAEPGFLSYNSNNNKTRRTHQRRNASIVVRPKSGAWPLEAVALVAGDKESVALTLAIADYVAEVDWLSRSLVVVVDESPRDFLEAYESSVDMDRGGVIRAALVLEEGPVPGLKVMGANGALPNMDLLYLLSISSENVEGTTKDERYWDRLKGILAWLTKSLGGPTGAHSFFLDRGVDALTVVGADPVQIELALRSLNNLEHKLHHSFFMYWLVSPKIFVSINEYAWPVMLLILPTALAAHRHFLLATSSTVAMLENAVKLMAAISLFLVKRVPISAAYLSAIFLARHQNDVIGLVCVFWAYVHAALLLPQPAVALLGALAVLPLALCSRHKTLLLLWWLSLLLLILLRILPALDLLEYHFTHFNDHARLLYVRGCLLPMHASVAGFLLTSRVSK